MLINYVNINVCHLIFQTVCNTSCLLALAKKSDLWVVVRGQSQAKAKECLGACSLRKFKIISLGSCRGQFCMDHRFILD